MVREPKAPLFSITWTLETLGRTTFANLHHVAQKRKVFLTNPVTKVGYSSTKQHWFIASTIE
jgi:hypothetical protein